MTIGGNVENWLTGSFSMTDNINDRSSCSFIVDSLNAIVIGDKVIIDDVFSGYVSSINKRLLKGTNIIRYSLNCVDYNHICDRITFVNAYENKTYFEIVDDMMERRLKKEGIAWGSYVGEDVILTKSIFNYETIADCLNKLRDITGINWNIDKDKKLNTFYREDNIDTEGFTSILDVEVQSEYSEYRNRQYIRAGKDTTAQQADEVLTAKPDGVSRIFRTRFDIAKKPIIKINGIEVDGDDIGINGLDENKKWYWNKGIRDIVQDENEAVLQSSDTITATYYGLVDITVVEDDKTGIQARKAVEGGTGLYENIRDEKSIESRTAAKEMALGLLKKWENIPERVIIRTRQPKQAGKIVTLNIPELGVDGQYLIDSIDISEDSGYFYYNCVCLSGESLGSWVEFFRELKRQGKDLQMNEAERLQITQTQDEGTEIGGVYTMTFYNVLYPSATLYPSTTLYPGTHQKEETAND